jgi:hypothetical protein
VADRSDANRLVVVGELMDDPVGADAQRAQSAQAALGQDMDISALHEGRLELNTAQARTDALHTIGGYPKTKGEVSTTDDRVNVTVTRHVQTILLGLVGVRTFTISAHASAAPRAP